MLFDENDNVDMENGTLPRMNFDSLIWSLVTVFGALVGENWNDVMYLCMRSSGWYVSIYFITLIVLGNIIMLNLFLAILLGNFDEASVFMKEKKYFETNMKREKEKSLILRKLTTGLPTGEDKSNLTPIEEDSIHESELNSISNTPSVSNQQQPLDHP